MNPLIAYGNWLSQPHSWPLEAVEAAHRQFIDIVAVSVPGSLEEAPRKVWEAVRTWGNGASTIIGMSCSLAAPWAALVNGTSAHALDFDDNFDPGKAHATAVLAPAILALAEQENAGGRACLDAYIAGIEILGRVGQGLNPVHRTRGWHATSTVGAVGAAAACARLLGLPAEQATHALAISTSMATGFVSHLGTMTKPLHAGLAAKAGVMAATLARAGARGGLGALDGVTGMTHLMVGHDYDVIASDAGMRFETERIGQPLLILSHGFRVKRFPNCASAHRAMEALFEIMEQVSFEASDVVRIVVRAPERQFRNLLFQRATTADEAKFSIEFALAAIVLHGDFGLGNFAEETLGDKALHAMCSLIERVPFDEALGLPTSVEVYLSDGRTFRSEVQEPQGSPSRPFRIDEYWTKFDTCLSGLVGAEQRERITSSLGSLPSLPAIGELMIPLAIVSPPSRARAS